MKNCLTLALFLVLNMAAFAQLANEEKIIEVYGTEWVARMQAEKPELLRLLDKFVSHGFLVQEVSDGKYTELEPLEFIPLREKGADAISVAAFLADYNSNGFNPLRYAFFPNNEYQVYKLKGVNYIIYILPQQTILQTP